MIFHQQRLSQPADIFQNGLLLLRRHGTRAVLAENGSNTFGIVTVARNAFDQGSTLDVGPVYPVGGLMDAQGFLRLHPEETDFGTQARGVCRRVVRGAANGDVRGANDALLMHGQQILHEDLVEVAEVVQVQGRICLGGHA